MIKITDGRRKTKKYRKVLRRLRLTFSPTSKYTGFWYTHDDSRFKELSWFCKRYKLNIQMLDENDTRYSRSSTYRQDFFAYNKGYKPLL